MTIYVEATDGYKCYLEQNEEGTLLEVDTDAFKGKCPEYITGCRYVPEGMEWTRGDGMTFYGEMVTPWKPFTELMMAQMAYELEQAKAELAEADTALEVVYGEQN